MLHIVFPGHSRKPFEIAHGRTSENYTYRHQSINKKVPSRQNVVEQPRAHLVANSSETAHPHGVRLRGRLCHHTGKDVSIHAPTRGATSGRSHDRLALTVSIHAHTWGTTACILSVYSLTIWFQSKLMHGRDLS